MTNLELATLYRETTLALAVAMDGTGDQNDRASLQWHIDNARDHVATAIDHGRNPDAHVFSRDATLAGIGQIATMLQALAATHGDCVATRREAKLGALRAKGTPRKRSAPRVMPDGERDQLDYPWNAPGAPFRTGDY